MICCLRHERAFVHRVHLSILMLSHKRPFVTSGVMLVRSSVHCEYKTRCFAGLYAEKSLAVKFEFRARLCCVDFGNKVEYKRKGRITCVLYLQLMF